MEEIQTVPLHLKDLRIITGSLENIISKSLRSTCEQFLVTSSTGQVCVTCSGFSILSALHISHPVGKVIMDSLASFYQIFGDGCKTLIIYIHGLLSAVELQLNKLSHQSSGDASFRTVVARSLQDFVHLELSHICEEVYKHISTQNCQENKCCQVFKRPLYYVIRPCFQGLPTQVCDHFTNILTMFVTYTMNTGLDLSIIQKFLDNFIFMVPNQLFTNSRISDGLFLQGNLFGQDVPSLQTKCIFLQCHIEGNVDKQATDSVALTDESTDKVLTYRTQVASRFLQKVKLAGVSCILTVHKVPAFVLQICHSLDLSVVSCLSDTDFDLVMHMTGMLPVTSVYDGVNLDNIITVASWKHTVVGGKDFVNLLLDESCAKYKLHALFLCVPVESLCQQIKMCVKKSLTIANHCLREPFSTSDRESVNGTSTFQFGINNEKTSLGFDPEFEKIQTPDRGREKEVEVSKVNNSSVLKNVIARGGYFEHVFIYFLKKNSQKNISDQRQLCCHFIIKMLENLPKILHNNQLVSQKSGRGHNFLYSQSEIDRAVAATLMAGVSTKTFHCFHSNALDVLNIKFEIVFAAINLVIKLLRIDYIVGVKRFIQETCHSDTDPQDYVDDETE